MQMILAMFEFFSSLENVWKYWLYAFFSVQKQDFVLFIDVSSCVYTLIEIL